MITPVQSVWNLSGMPFVAALAAVVFAAPLAGCKLGPDYRRPNIDSPDQWRAPHQSSTSLANLEWWKVYQDSVLTNLIGTALTNSKDIRIAAARVEQALGSYRAQRSSLLPTVNAAGTWTRGRSGYTERTANQFELFGLLSYEVDVWGRLRRLTEASRAELLASEEGRKTVAITLVASIAQTYFNLRALDEQLEISRRTYVSRTNSLNLTKVKFNNGQGITSELDVRQAETQVYLAQASIAQIERAIAITENAISFLVGNNPGPVPRGKTLAEQPQPLEIPAGLPSQLLLNRPDLRAAEQSLIAANANIGAARAAYFPQISLTAALGLQSLELDDLFDAGTARAWSFAPQVATPIFNAGRIRAGVQVAEAQRREALASYEQAIQDAFREVSDALISVAKLREQIVAEEGNVMAERRRLELSMLRYRDGVSSFSEVLDAERFLFNAELNLVQTRSDALAAFAQLYRALGGGWSTASETPDSGPIRPNSIAKTLP